MTRVVCTITLWPLWALTFCLVAAGCANEKKNHSKHTIVGDETFTHNGLERTYKIYVPTNLSPNSPAVFLLHGMNSTSDWSYHAGFNGLADKHGFLAVYPQSHRKRIKLGPFTIYNVRWNPANEDELYEGRNDVEFLSSLALYLEEKFQLNSAKTFVAGFSIGGAMSYTLMCQAGDVFEAAAVVSGLIVKDIFANCDPGTPKSIVHLHGTDDSLAPINGERKGSKSGTDIGMEKTVEYFAKFNNAFEKETTQVSSTAQLTRYTSNGNGIEVQYYRIENHGHLWPGGDTGGKKINDESGLNATAIIANFFAQL